MIMKIKIEFLKDFWFIFPGDVKYIFVCDPTNERSDVTILNIMSMLVQLSVTFLISFSSDYERMMSRFQNLHPKPMYSTCSIISGGLYILDPIFKGQKGLFKGLFSYNSGLNSG